MAEAIAHTIQSLAQRGLGRSKIYQAIREGELVARKIGKRTVVLDDDLKRYLEHLPKVGATAA